MRPGTQTVAERSKPADPTDPAFVSDERRHVLLERLVTIYQRVLANTPSAQQYLEKRSLADRSVWEHYRIGYSDGRLSELLPRDGAVQSELSALGILSNNQEELLASCLVFPVLDLEGRVVTLVARYTDDREPPEAYLAGQKPRIWNAPATKIYCQLFLVTSVLDALSLRTAGFANVVAAVGAAELPADEVALFSGHGVNQITLVLKRGDPGPVIASALPHLSCETQLLPDGYDVNAYVRAYGPACVASFVNDKKSNGPQNPGAQSQTAVLPDGFAVALGLRRYQVRGLQKAPRTLKATVRAEQGGKLHIDTLDFYAARSRRQLTQDLCRVFELSAEAAGAEINKLLDACERHNPNLASETSAPAPAVNPEGRTQAEAFGRSHDLLDRIASDYERCGLVGERANRLLCYLALTSRKMDKPLSVLILSSSGAGKSMLQDTTLLFCPPEDLVKVTSLSSRALFYKAQDSLKHKVLALEEGEGMVKATYALRNLISAGELIVETTIRDQASGKPVTVQNRVKGPTTVFITTTNPAMDPETKSRFFVTGVDESREQTRAILAAQRQQHVIASGSLSTELEQLLCQHRNFQRLLRPVTIVNAYAAQLTYSDDRLQSRRDQPKYLNLIRAVAFLRQMQKPIKSSDDPEQRHECIEVDLNDIRLANELMTEIFGHTLDELSRPSYELLLLLEQMTAQEGVSRSVSRREIREFRGWSNLRVHRYVRELVELEYVLLESGRNGVPYRYRIAYAGQGKDGQKFLLGLRPIDQLRGPAA
jgi:hypothetical protein